MRLLTLHNLTSWISVIRVITNIFLMLIFLKLQYLTQRKSETDT